MLSSPAQPHRSRGLASLFCIISSIKSEPRLAHYYGINARSARLGVGMDVGVGMGVGAGSWYIAGDRLASGWSPHQGQPTRGSSILLLLLAVLLLLPRCAAAHRDRAHKRSKALEQTIK